MASGSRSMCASELRRDFIRRNSRSSEQALNRNATMLKRSNNQHSKEELRR
jgi:hypothetical protein